MKRFTIVFTILIILAISCSVFSQSGKNAIKALKKLNAKVETGISYKDYSTVLGEVNYEVKTFLESREAKAKPKLRESIIKVMGYYISSKEVWDLEYEVSGYMSKVIVLSGDLAYTGVTRKDKILNIIKLYPELATAKQNISNNEVIITDEIVHMLWKAASTELKRADSLL